MTDELLGLYEKSIFSDANTIVRILSQGAPPGVEIALTPDALDASHVSQALVGQHPRRVRRPRRVVSGLLAGRHRMYLI